MRLFVQLLSASNFRRFLCSSEGSRSLVTVNDAISQWTNVFKKNNIPEPENSIEHIIAHVLGLRGISSVYDVGNDCLTEKQMGFLETCCECRLARMPVQYIIKEWDFRNLNLIMSPPVFIPRPETEELIDIITDYVKKRKVVPENVLEIGCGTGAIILSLIQELPMIQKTFAIDKSNLACLLAKKNSMNVSLKDKLSIMNGELKEDGTIKLLQNGTNGIPDVNFDIIVSNPPYVPNKKLYDLAPEIKLYEDLRALDGGPAGMHVIERLLILASKKLVSEGSLFMEIDDSQPELIKKWIESNRDSYSLTLLKVYKDFNKKNRFVHIMKK